MAVVKGLWAMMFGALMMSGYALADDARPAVAEKVLAYQSEQGIKVWTLRIGERSAHQALVQVEGVDHDWNMRIQKMDIEQTFKDTRYFTEVNGKKFVALILQNSWGQLYLPGDTQERAVVYSEDLSSQGNAQAFLTDYLSQQ